MFANLVHAADSQATIVAKGFLVKINTYVFFPLIIFLTALALLMFLFGVMRYVFNADNSDAREKGRRHMIFGIIGLLVMVSAYTILTIAANSIGAPVPAR